MNKKVLFTACALMLAVTGFAMAGGTGEALGKIQSAADKAKEASQQKQPEAVDSAQQEAQFSVKPNAAGDEAVITGYSGTDSENIAQGNNLEEKMDWLKIFAKDGARYVVEFNEDETFVSTLNIGSVQKRISVIFRGIGENRTLKVSSIIVNRNTELILDNNITIRPPNNRERENPLITVGENGRLVMNNGSTITGASSSSTGGAVTVDIGTFTMNGGTITGNTARRGGGVHVTVDGRFEMKGGTISGNTARQNGGGVNIERGEFTKTGGTITGYTSDQSNGNVVKTDSGVRNFNGHAVYAFSNNPKIRDKTAGEEDNMSFNNSKASGTWDN